ncbi:hypothetical protein F1654_01125 [Alkalicaulis satelles]|uniref:Uncharacterized protein n=1 Tax=Alkalicaulis satelles TaxID=2609175 RepID=A0A5M6ZN17_9PROT|nr:hypothetical protein [Alkalicaulis satelles]KAA5804638.1 hypothetical protein F1654_01125 [Alkalicaulis satelles]
MLELTLILVIAAGVLFVLLRPRAKRLTGKAEDAARKAVERRLQQDGQDRDETGGKGADPRS